MERQFATFQRTRGVFVGIPESLRQLQKAGDAAGGTLLRLIRDIIPRIRAASGGVFLTENLEEFGDFLEKMSEPSKKFETALAESQQKVRVELAKTVVKLQEVGIALFDLGSSITGGAGFEGVRDILESIRSGIEKMTVAITAARPRVRGYVPKDHRRLQSDLCGRVHLRRQQDHIGLGRRAQNRIARCYFGSLWTQRLDLR